MVRSVEEQAARTIVRLMVVGSSTAKASTNLPLLMRRVNGLPRLHFMITRLLVNENGSVSEAVDSLRSAVKTTLVALPSYSGAMNDFDWTAFVTWFLKYSSAAYVSFMDMLETKAILGVLVSGTSFIVHVDESEVQKLLEEVFGTDTVWT